jgi:hypothetical protein
VQGCRGREEPPDRRGTADGREPVGSLRAHEREGVPVALEDVRREASDTTIAEAHGGWGEAVDVLPVQEGVLQFRCREAVGCWVRELSQQAYCTDLGLLGPLALATELKCSNHVLTQWSHASSPFVSGRVVRVRRKTS